MGLQDFLNKLRYWDNASAKWMMRHFYILFFEIVLVVVFLAFLFNSLRYIDISIELDHSKVLEHMLFLQSINTVIIVILMLLNSFWLLYIFNGLIRLKTILKDISYLLNKRLGSRNN